MTLARLPERWSRNVTSLDGTVARIKGRQTVSPVPADGERFHHCTEVVSASGESV